MLVVKIPAAVLCTPTFFIVMMAEKFLGLCILDA